MSDYLYIHNLQFYLIFEELKFADKRMLVAIL